MNTQTEQLRTAMRQPIAPVLSFALANLKGSLRNKAIMAATLFTPVFLLIIFWLISMATKQSAGAEAPVDLLPFMFPGLLAFTIIQSGGIHAVTIVSWREKGIFRRLACTPIPLWKLVLGRAIAQVVFSLMQGAFVVIVGLLLTGLPVSWDGLLLSFLILTIAAACFIALGSLLAAFTRNPIVANSLYMFLVIPMMFLGDFLMPGNILPEGLSSVGRLLPTAMTTALIRPLISTGVLPVDASTHLLGLLAYTLVFVLLSARLFRWE